MRAGAHEPLRLETAHYKQVPAVYEETGYTDVPTQSDDEELFVRHEARPD